MVLLQGMGWSEPGTAKEAAREGWRLRHPIRTRQGAAGNAQSRCREEVFEGLSRRNDGLEC